MAAGAKQPCLAALLVVLEAGVGIEETRSEGAPYWFLTQVTVTTAPKPPRWAAIV